MFSYQATCRSHQQQNGCSKTSDTPLTIEVKECIKHDINTRYQNEEMSLLLDICVFLDPRFKHRCSMEDEPVVKLMDEVKIKMKFYKLTSGNCKCV